MPMMQPAPEKKQSWLDRSIFSVIPWNLETALFLAIFVLGALLRFWDLGSRALHHDESIHAVHSWYILSGKGAYRQDPTYHGPFLYYSQAMAYFLFGATDYAARIMPAIFGTILVTTPMLLKRYLGRVGALATALMIAISPSILYYSRALRHDMFSLVGTVVVIIAFFRFMEDRRLRWVYLGAVAYTIGYANHELMLLITTPMVGLALVCTLVWENFISRGEKPLTDALRGVPGQVWVNCVLIFLALYIPLYTSLFTNMAGLFTGSVGAITYWLSQQAVRRGDQPWFYYGLMLPLEEFLPLFFSLCAGAVLGWRRLFGGRGRAAGTDDRGKPLAVGASRGRPLLDTYFLLFSGYWAVLSLLLYSYAGEKMPWLTIHITMPLIVLAGWFLNRFLTGVDWRSLFDRGGLLLATAVPITLLALGRWLTLRPAVGGTSVAQQQSTMDWLALLIILALGVGVVVWCVTRLGARQSFQSVGLLILAGMVVFTVHTTIMVSFVLADVPKDPLIYVQSTPDVTNVQNKIDNLSQRLTSGKDLVVMYDDETSWPYSWYLKDYGKAIYQPKGPTSPPEAPVVLVGLVNDDPVRPLMGKYTRTPLKMRSWFPEDGYKTLTVSGIANTITDPVLRDRFWRFLLNRELFDQVGNEVTAGKLGSTDFVVYVRKDLSDSFWGPGLLAGTETQPREDPYAGKQRSVGAILSFGAKGSADGQFAEPKGITVDSAGDIYVTDTQNHRIQKFDAAGKYLLKWGAKGEGDGQFTEPWGVAVDKAGNVYVADTFNYRIQKFDSAGKFLAKWGAFVDTRGQAGGSTAGLYGPRAIAFDGNGNLWVTDTGNKRLMKYDTDGKFLAQFGSVGTDDGRFNEPVGLAIDPGGNIYVADTWNQRIQKFDASFKLLAQWPVAGWDGGSVLNKPFLAADADGVYATDPEQHHVLRFNSTGSVLAVFGQLGMDTSSFNMPIGIALDGANNLYVTDAFNNRVLKFAPVR
jgi:uncharacterized protein (TIGR03663 family)